MGIVIYIIEAIVFIVIIIFVIGLLLPKQRIETRETVYEVSPKEVFDIVTNNNDWKYRSDLKNLKIVEINNNVEEWEEISKDDNIIRFKTREKRPYSYYSFDMESKVMKGFWTAEFKELENNNTLFIATEYIEMKNPFLRVLSYLFFDIGKYMETYQEDLGKRIKLCDR